jgi:mannitol-1-phosphate/altronate dehydrogenase
VAADGSVKLVQRLYPTVLIRLQRQLPIDACTRALALWIDHIARSGNDLVDPNAGHLLRRLQGARSSSDMARAILTDAALVPARLGQADVTDPVAHHLDGLQRRKSGGPAGTGTRPE